MQLDWDMKDWEMSGLLWTNWNQPFKICLWKRSSTSNLWSVNSNFKVKRFRISKTSWLLRKLKFKRSDNRCQFHLLALTGWLNGRSCLIGQQRGGGCNDSGYLISWLFGWYCCPTRCFFDGKGSLPARSQQGGICGVVKNKVKEVKRQR